MLDSLEQDDQLTKKLLQNLTDYCSQVKAKLAKEPQLVQEDRANLKLIGLNQSHDEEISGRLNFLQFYALNSKQF